MAILCFWLGHLGTFAKIENTEGTEKKLGQRWALVNMSLDVCGTFRWKHLEGSQKTDCK
jgi:hypothetical protein